MVGRLVRTAGGTAAVDGGNPEVGGAGVKDNLEGLRRSANGDHTIVGELPRKREKSNSEVFLISFGNQQLLN